MEYRKCGDIQRRDGIHKTRQDKTRQDRTRQVKTRQDKLKKDKKRQDKKRQDKTRQNKTRQDKTRVSKPKTHTYHYSQPGRASFSATLLARPLVLFCIQTYI